MLRRAAKSTVGFLCRMYRFGMFSGNGLAQLEIIQNLDSNGTNDLKEI